MDTYTKKELKKYFNYCFCRAYDNFSWIPVVGPMIGASLGGLVYKALVGHHLTEEKCSEIESSSELPEKCENVTTVA